MAQPARDLGGNDNAWHTWIGQYHRVERQEQQGNDAHRYEELKRLRKDKARLKEERTIWNNRFVALPRHLWWKTLESVGYRDISGRSDRRLIGGDNPGKKPGPGNLRMCDG